MLHLDLLRLVAALAIVICHFWLDVDAPAGVRYLLGRLGDLNVFVDVFFVISGIVIATVYDGRLGSGDSYARFLQKRVARLLPLHWATLAFYVVLALAAAHLGEVTNATKYDWDCLLPNALMAHAGGMCRSLSFNGVSWSISAEMAMYLVAPLVIALAAKSPGTLLGLAVTVLVGLFGFDAIAHPARLWHERTYDVGIVRAVPAFLLGATAYAFRGYLRRWRSPRAWAVALFALLILGVCVGAPKGGLVLAAYGLAAATYAADLRTRAGPAVRALAPGGQLTYSLYMLHPVVGVVVIKILGTRLLHLSGAPLNLLILAAIPVTVVVGYVSFVALERPARRWISGLGGGAASGQEHGAGRYVRSRKTRIADS